jgi:hypothetical protein
MKKKTDRSFGKTKLGVRNGFTDFERGRKLFEESGE